jgi:hypothetical protein
MLRGCQRGNCRKNAKLLHPKFKAFFVGFSAAVKMRLAALGITGYAISEVRAIEAAAFELA